MLNKVVGRKHNPIKRKIDISRLSNVKIEYNEQGVLCANGRIRRVLKPGEKLGLEDRLAGGLSIFIIDAAPHDLIWDVKFLSKDEPKAFHLMISLQYRILDARRMIEDNIQDTESVIVAALTPLLRREARRYSLYEHQSLETMLEDLITPELFASLGFELMTKKDVEFIFSDEELEDLKALVRAMNVPQQTKHKEILPTKDADAKYHAMITVNYKVIDFDRLPTKTMAEAEKWLWNRVLTTLRREGRKHTIDQIAMAEQSMQDAVESEIYSDHGLEIVSILVAIDLESVEKTIEMGKVQDDAAMEIMLARVAQVRQARTQEQQKNAIDFYAPYIKEGQWQMLAMSLGNNEKDANAVLKYLDEHQREQFQIEREKYNRRADLQEKLIDYALKHGDGLSEKTAANIIDSMAEDITSEVYKELPKKTGKTQPEKSAEE